MHSMCVSMCLVGASGSGIADLLRARWQDKAIYFPISSSSATICTGASATLTAASVSGASYAWKIIGGSTFSTSSSVSVSPSSTTTYVLTVSKDGCSSTDQVTVTVNALPTVDAGSDQTVCSGTSLTLSGSGASSCC